MPQIQSSEPCTICLVNESVMHSHHTVPQSRGGENSRQIILCSSCHNILHANALYIVSKVRNPNRPAKSFWNSEEERLRADPWLQILVQALLVPVDEAVEVTERPVGTKLSVADFNLFKLLVADLGCSQEQAVAYCIKYVLKKKGFDNEKTKPDLWFLPVSRTR